MKKQLICFFLLPGIFLLFFANIYPKEDVEIVIQTGHKRSVISVCISPDGKTIVSGSSDETIRLWDKETGKEIRRLQGHTGGVNSVAISSDGKAVVSGGYDDKIKIWDFTKGNLVATLIDFKDGEWVTYTPDNYYISSPKGDKYISFRVGSKLSSFEQYSEIYKKEDVVSRVLKGEDINNVLAELQMEKVDITQIPAPVVVINYFEIGENLIKPEK